MNAREAEFRPDIWLTPDEVRRLAGGKVYRPAQRRALQRKKVPFIEAAGGEPLVLRAVVERRGGLGRAQSPEPARDPDFSVFPSVS
jgi:hypothetical protein